MENIVFIGNPGGGKSTILNSILCEVRFKSGMSTVKGMTQTSQFEVKNNICYIDTPGLSDLLRRKEAAVQIENAFSKDGKYKIVYVMTLEAGRIKSDDLTSAELIYDAIRHFGIPCLLLINKLPPNTYLKLKNENTPDHNFLWDQICSNLPFVGNNIFLMQNEIGLMDADNLLLSYEKIFSFVFVLNKMESKELKANQVKNINSETYKELEERKKRETMDLLHKIESLEKDLEEMRNRPPVVIQQPIYSPNNNNNNPTNNNCHHKCEQCSYPCSRPKTLSHVHHRCGKHNQWHK